MAFNIVQVVPAVSNNGSNAATFPVTINGVTPGNSLLIFAPSYNTSGSQLVTASGFVAASFASSDGVTSGNILVQAVAAGGNTTITLNVGSYSYTKVTILEVSGLDAAPLDLSFGTSGSAATLTATATSATAKANEVVIGMLWIGAGASWPTQGSYTTAYIDNNNGPASQAFYGNLTAIQPALSVTANNNTGSTVGFLCVTLKLTGGPLSVSSTTKSSTSLTGLNSIRSSVTSTSRFAAALNADIIRAGSFTGTMHGKSQIAARLAQAFVSSTSGWSSALYGFALGNSPNNVNVVQVASLLNAGNGWNVASVSVGCNSGDTLVVLTANNNKNLSGTYTPTVNQGVLQQIVDQQSAALGLTYPLYVQAYIMPYIKAGTYTFTPPNEGSGGSGTMTVLRLSGVLGLRNGSVSTVLFNTGTYSLVTTNSSANAGDFLLSVATTLGQVITPPINDVSASRSVINNGASSSVDSRTVPSTGVHQSTWNWGNATPAAAAVTFALIPTVNPNATSTIFGYTKQTGAFIRANPLLGKIRAATTVNSVASLNLPFSSSSKTRLRMSAGALLPMFSAATLNGTRVLLATARFPLYEQAKIKGAFTASFNAVNLQYASSAIHSISSAHAKYGILSNARIFSASKVNSVAVPRIYANSTVLSSGKILSEYGLQAFSRIQQSAKLAASPKQGLTATSKSSYALSAAVSSAVSYYSAIKSSGFLAAQPLAAGNFTSKIAGSNKLSALPSLAISASSVIYGTSKNYANLHQVIYSDAQLRGFARSTAAIKQYVKASANLSRASFVHATIAQNFYADSVSKGQYRVTSNLLHVLKSNINTSTRIGATSSAEIHSSAFIKYGSALGGVVLLGGQFSASIVSNGAIAATAALGISATSAQKSYGVLRATNTQHLFEHGTVRGNLQSRLLVRQIAYQHGELRASSSIHATLEQTLQISAHARASIKVNASVRQGLTTKLGASSSIEGTPKQLLISTARVSGSTTLFGYNQFPLHLYTVIKGASGLQAATHIFIPLSATIKQETRSTASMVLHLPITGSVKWHAFQFAQQSELLEISATTRSAIKQSANPLTGLFARISGSGKLGGTPITGWNSWIRGSGKVESTPHFRAGTYGTMGEGYRSFANVSKVVPVISVINSTKKLFGYTFTIDQNTPIAVTDYLVSFETDTNQYYVEMPLAEAVQIEQNEVYYMVELQAQDFVVSWQTN